MSPPHELSDPRLSVRPARFGVPRDDLPSVGSIDRPADIDASTASPSARRRVRRHLLSRPEVRHHIDRARMLSDRSGRRFSVATFGCGSRSLMLELEHLLLNRMRGSDEAGLAPRQICREMNVAARHCLTVILPETMPAGAVRFAEDVAGRFPGPDRPKIALHHYPHDSGSGSGDSGGIINGNAACQAGICVSNVFARPLPRWKRALDVAAAGLGLLTLAPLMGLIALAIRLDSRGPSLFWQKRAGLGGRTFEIAKFRTMVVDAERLMVSLDLRSRSEQNGAAFKLRRDPRVTRVGMILRATSLDELPQLWNILVGDMTLVGPRPLPVSESDACEPWQRRRLDVTPGLTCIWQVHGRSRVEFDDWMRMDLRYVRRSEGAFGVLHDLTLLMKTLPAIFLKRGF